MQHHPQLALRVVDVLSNRLKQVHELLGYIAMDDIRSKLLYLLLRLAAEFGAEDQGDWTLISADLTHQDLATMIGATRETVSTTLAALSREGIAMHMMGMIGMIAGLVGSQSVAVAWIVHLVISAIFGVAYPLLFGNMKRQWLGGLIYGFIWYLLGPLTLMPLLMGAGVQWSMAAVVGSMFSVVGHLMYGLILGLVFDRLEKSQVTASEKDARQAVQ